jgi:V/A-type H+-transporting ATPase subunit E
VAAETAVSLDTLITTLSAEAGAEVAAVRARARSEADAITAESAKGIEQRRAAAQATLERDRRDAVERALSESRFEARRIVLEARKQLIAQVVAAARERLPVILESAEYRATLTDRVAEALACVGGRRVTLRAHPAIASVLPTMVTDLAAVVADPDVGSGFRVVTDDGAIEVDGTLEARLEALAPVLSLEIVKVIEENS